jgi:pyridinium-3,5-biscarboxylic acid mononucleotide sulfurtransferase
VNHPPLAEAPRQPAGDAGAVSGDAGYAAPTHDAALAFKHDALRSLLSELPSIIVAYSGGVDSAYLAYAATATLGPRALCVTADSPSYPDRHRRLAMRLAREFGFRHEIIETGELQRAEYRANPANRCYFCKHELYTHLTAIARDRGIAVIADGSNADDRGDYRPGRQAAREFGVRSPLDDVGLTKAEIRELARRDGLPTWNEPASACLSSRIPYFSEVTDAKLRMIERAEAVLRDFGFQIVRVRHHETMARIELGRDELARALEPEMSQAISHELRAIGYEDVTIDPRGYRLGSLNDALRLRPL